MNDSASPDPRDTQQCNPAAIERYLEQTSDDAERIWVEQHLDHCERCQELIQSKLGNEWWSRAKEFLTTDAIDHRASSSAVFSNGYHGLGADTVAAFDESTRFEVHHDGLKRVLEMLSQADAPRMLGRLDQYEIEEAIGCGGMAVVLKGFEPSLNRHVAIKVLAPHLSSSQTARERFSREAKAAASVLHPNVIAIYRVSQFKHLPYLVMPYISGGTLQDRMHANENSLGGLDIEQILRVGEHIASGLAAAHEQGLVHRDIKPANVLLEPNSDIDSERVVITDFGLARAADDATLTRTGILAGTPHYMSPEQAKGEHIDHRSDLFSLGSLLFKLATGRVPFDAETSYGLLRKIVESDAPDPREFNDQVPDWLANLIGKLHRRDPKDRYQSASEVAELLRQCDAAFRSGTPIPNSLTHDNDSEKRWSGSSHKRQPWVLIAGLAVTLLLAGIGFWIRAEQVSSKSASSKSASISGASGAIPHNSTTESQRPPETEPLPAIEALPVTWPNGPWAEVRGQFVWKGTVPERNDVVVTRDYALYEEPIEDESLLVNASGGLANVFVWLEDDRLTDSNTKSQPSPMLFQFDEGRIEPHATIMRPQQTLRLRNRDPIRHYVFMGDVMNVSLPAGSLFANEFPVQSEPMKIACEVHPWFASYVLIQDHRYATISDRDGMFVLERAPKGSWKLRVWHESLGELDLTEQSSVRAGADGQILVVDRPEISMPSISVGLKRKVAEKGRDGI